MNFPPKILRTVPIAISLVMAIVGLAEAFVCGADPVFAACFYGTAALVISYLVVPVLLWAANFSKISLKFEFLLLASVFGSSWASSLVIGRFLIFRNIFNEHQEKSLLATLFAFMISLFFAGILTLVAHYYLKMATLLSNKIISLVPAFLLLGFVAYLFPETVIASAGQADYSRHPGGTVLIVVDTLRADVLDFYSERGPHDVEQRPLPVLDKLASHSLIFDRLYSQASWTKPAVATLMTGKLSRQHGAIYKTSILTDEHDTLAELFQKHGYHTLAVANNANLTADFGFAQGFDNYRYLYPDRYFNAPQSAVKLSLYNIVRLLWERYSPITRDVGNFYMPAETVSREALSLLDKEYSEKPFFLYLHYMEPHDPYFAKNGQSFARVSMPHPSEKMARPMLEAYLDEIERLDEGLGPLFAGLADRGLSDKVRIIFTADHGEEFLDHGGFYHGTTLYNEQLHIPLLLSGPEIIPGRFTELARQQDILPTIAVWHGWEVPDGIAGRDLLHGPAPSAHLAEEDHQGNRLTAIINNEYSLIMANPNNPRGLAEYELYRQEDDFKQKENLAQKQAAVVDELKVLESTFGEISTVSTGPALSPDQEAQLRSLGYIE